MEFALLPTHLPSKHTVSSQNLRSLSVFLILLGKVANKLMTLDKNLLNGESLEVKCAISRKILKKKSQIFALFSLIAPNGATVRGSVFKMKFRVWSREFESIETSPGFAQLLEENWIQNQ